MNKHTLISSIIYITLLSLIIGCQDAALGTIDIGTISGRVLDEVLLTGVPGVLITTSPGIASTLTDANGNFKIKDIPGDTYVISAVKNGYNDGTQNVSVTHGDATKVIIMIHHSADLTGTIRGTVYDENENRCSGVNISTEPGTRVALTDASGDYVMDGIPEGEYTIIVKKPGYMRLTPAIYVKAGTDTTADFIIEPGS